MYYKKKIKRDILSTGGSNTLKDYVPFFDDDENVLNIAYALEGAMEYKNQIAKEVKHD